MDKRMTAVQVVAELRDGMTLGIGGWGSRRKPMALVREILRSDLKDLTVVTYGAMMRPTLEAVEEVKEKRGVGIALIDLLTIAPMDSDRVIESVKRTGRCVVVQEAPRSLSVASEIIARINERSFLYLEAPVNQVANYDVVTPYFGREMMYIPSPERIRRALEETLDF